MCFSNPRGSAEQVDEYKLDDSDTDEFFFGALENDPGNEKDCHDLHLVERVSVVDT